MPATILVVEDNPITRKLMRVTLETGGYLVLEAESAQAALSHAAARRPDLVLQDFVLPDMDGLQLMAAFHALPGCAELPVLVITGMVSQLEELSARGDAHTTFLAKPIEPSRLLEIVGTHFDRRVHARGRGRRVLVVDDEPHNRKLASLRLSDAGFLVETADSGPAALARMRVTAPDAVLSDVMMPGLDGFALCETIRRDPALSAIPVVLLSAAYVEEEDRRLAGRLAANALVLRTPDLTPAIEALLAALDRRVQFPSLMAPGEVDGLHRERVQLQLERQLARNESLLRQAAIQAAALSVVRGLADALAEPASLPRILGDVLVHCLDAAGLSTGLLYLVGGHGRLDLQAQAGLPFAARPAAAACFGRRDVLERVLASGRAETYVGGHSDQEGGAREILTGLAKASALVIPFIVGEERVGVLVMGADTQDLSDPSWVAFANALSTQFGQTIAVGQSLSRGAASEARYASLMENASDAILVLTRDQFVLEANRQAERLLGRPRRDIVGRRYEGFVMPHERDEARRDNERLLAEKAVHSAHRILRADGAQIAVEASGALVRSGDEDVVLMILRDVTERERAAAELVAAQEHLRHVVSSSPAVIYTLQVVGDILAPAWVSDNIQTVLGYAPAEVRTFEWWREKLHPDDRGRLQDQVPELLERGHVEREYRLLHKDGEYIWVRDEQRLHRDRSGNPVEVIGAWWDVTDRKAADLRLEESERQYRLLFEEHPQPLWVFDLETLAFLDVNAAAVRHYGYTRNEFLGMTIKDIRPLEEVEELLSTLKRQALAPGKGIWKHRHKDGRILLVEVVSSPIEFHGRRAELILANDVTEKVTLEAQLLQSQKMEAIGQLAGGVAHDFNNLLGVITGYTELMLRDLGSLHPAVPRAEQIRKAAERAAGLTRQLLAFSRRQLLEPKVLNLNAIVSEIEPMLRRLIGEDVQLVAALQPDLGHVRADPGQVEQVIMNLAVNARDAMPSGGRIAIETSNVDLGSAELRGEAARPGTYVRLALSDSGQGMDPATLAHVFEPFFTTKEKGKGTGLGLSTVFGIVKQSEGHVTVESEVGRGSTFSIYLPRVMASAESLAARPEPSESEPVGSGAILLVEDAEALRMMIGELLTAAGYRVVVTADPAEALEIAVQGDTKFDLLLTDVIMPGMSGIELATRVKQAQPTIRAIYMSGYAESAVGHEGVIDAGTNFLQKPFSTAALLQRVRAVLDRPGASTR